YALDADKPIIVTQISSLVIFLLLCFSLIGLLQEDYGIFIALLVSFSFLCLSQYIYSWRLLKKYEHSYSS
ncbi:hypothetical protein WAH83_21290, partial [Acinetobacter baumannii]